MVDLDAIPQKLDMRAKRQVFDQCPNSIHFLAFAQRSKTTDGSAANTAGIALIRVAWSFCLEKRATVMRTLFPSSLSAVLLRSAMFRVSSEKIPLRTTVIRLALTPLLSKLNFDASETTI
ncbi:hypothetical protein T190_31095 [Sinorhizobium meliloti CCBAU 01290]|nr:hypothetical protein T190_31095 [Sinorhizobium meliloti CCBAU 01290]